MLDIAICNRLLPWSADAEDKNVIAFDQKEKTITFSLSSFEKMLSQVHAQSSRFEGPRIDVCTAPQMLQRLKIRRVPPLCAIGGTLAEPKVNFY
jgi:hypothetical protein